MKTHNCQAIIEWTGNLGTGTSSYKAYERSHSIKVDDKVVIESSSDPSFLGDSSKHNPEELFLASLSSCHMLWFLHLCSVEGVIVFEYVDRAEGIMKEVSNGSGRFTEVLLKPEITVAEERMREKLDFIHERANRMCFIANSCNFPVRHRYSSKVQEK